MELSHPCRPDPARTLGLYWASPLRPTTQYDTVSNGHEPCRAEERSVAQHSVAHLGHANWASTIRTQEPKATCFGSWDPSYCVSLGGSSSSDL